tara:strand:- start:8614 stop:8850 length:237 start_codon:yes stop_codon:yes gene_type:complete
MGFHKDLDKVFDRIINKMKGKSLDEKEKSFDENCESLKDMIHDLYDVSWHKKGVKLKHSFGENLEIVLNDNKENESIK